MAETKEVSGSKPRVMRTLFSVASAINCCVIKCIL